uniref:Uncharacterized protein n=1 Tax=Rhizophora mucronata TaxID=61149 RepID=A0A2P2PXK0_RHIMU
MQCILETKCSTCFYLRASILLV